MARSAKAEKSENHSGWLLGLGVLFIIFGMILILHPIASTLALTVFLGVLMFIAGLAQFAFAFSARKWTGFFFMFIMSLIFLTASFLLFFNPIGAVLTLTLLLGAILIVGGCVKIAMSETLKQWVDTGWLFLDGFLGVLLGILIVLAWPSDAAWVIGLLFGINLLFGGITFLMISFAMRKA